MNIKQQRAAALKAAQDIITGAKSAERDLTKDEQATVEEKFAEVEKLDAQIKEAEKSDSLMGRMESFGGGGSGPDEDVQAKSIGEHFAQSLKGRSIKSMGRFATPEFKVNTDTQETGGHAGAFGPLLTDVDRSFVLPFRRRLVVADLMGVGTVSGNALTYPVFGALEGGSGFVAEGGQKPQLHVADPTWRTDALGEVAGWFKITDDMSEDLSYVVSEIEGTARYELLTNEEQALLTGNGTAPNLEGVLSRTGVQTETSTDNTDNADAIFRALMKVQTATGFSADGIVINQVGS